MPKETTKEQDKRLSCDTYRIMTVRFNDGRELIASVRGDVVTDAELVGEELQVYEVQFSQAYPLPEGYYFESWGPDKESGPTLH